VNRKQRRAEGKSGKSTVAAPSASPADIIFAGAFFHHQSGRLHEAEIGYRDVLSRNPRHSDALSHLGMLAYQSGHKDSGIDLLERAIASDKRNPSTYYNLANMVADAGRYEDAIKLNRKAIALKPDYVDAHCNLGALLSLCGQPDEALAALVAGLKVKQTASLKSTFAITVQSLNPSKAKLSTDLLYYLARAIIEPWARPRDLGGVAIDLVTRDPIIADAIERVSRIAIESTSDIFSVDESTNVSKNELFLAILTTASVTSTSLEQLLTALRRTLLHDYLVESGERLDKWLPFISALAQQCFINEYVFGCTEQEGQQISALVNDITNSLDQNAPVAPVKIALVATYMSLNSIPEKEKLASRDWPEPVRALMVQQILNPKAEQNIRATIESLTPISGTISQKVRAQYEENPYPAWTNVVADPPVVPIDQYIRARFPGAEYQTVGRGPLNILVAGCGTGMHAIQRAQQFWRADVLAIDLSLSSLSYAIRKTREMGIKNIRYRQADILEFTTDKAFDVVDSSGVLHHLENPVDGWRRLAGAVRPGGLMHIGLYSSTARQAVNIARESFAKEGRQFSPADARRLRTDISNRPADDPVRKVTRYSDFYSMSEFRDLLFHVQEHQFSLPQIKTILDDLGFTFLGFETSARNAYLKRFPGDPVGDNLDNWHIFERENPATFAQMYQFWAQKN
jgi:2-polyprenyl-3-methyl-5-hydroxy-6-metoxy-1,4-benzoquinol methylase/Tfp pilus assembly protein PilF